MLRSYRRSIIWLTLSLAVGYLVISSYRATPYSQPKPLASFNPKFVSDLFAMTAVLLVIVGLGVSFAGWRANINANQQAAKLVSAANNETKNAGVPKHSTANNVPSTTKPGAGIYASYSVSPDQPRYLMIPKLNVAARVLAVGVNADGAIQTPSNVYDTAWYNGSAYPGQAGAMLIDGHISSWTEHGVFYDLQILQPGDLIKIQRGDGTTFSYLVSKTQLYDSTNVDMAAAVSPINPGRPGLNLITCAGSVIRGSNEFSKRLIVFATQI